MPPSEPTHPENLAKAPFDDAKADLILESSDKVHFRVFKIILSLASQMFAGMFSLPSPPSQNSLDEVQVVPLSEHSTALDVALRHIYPMRPPKADPLHYASILAEFARKYQVEALDNSITGYLMDSVERDPVGVYAIAVSYGYNEIGANAARSCLNLPFSDLQSPYLRCATAEHISGLYMYHVACGEAASALASSDRTYLLSLDQDRIFNPPQAGGISCPTCFVGDPQTSGPAIRSGPRWLWNYLYRSALVLAHHPTTDEISTEDFVLKTNDCRSCPPSRLDMLEIGVVLRREISNAVKRVSSCCPMFSDVQ
jgi:hypothetical protein